MDDHGATGPHAGEHAVLAEQDVLDVGAGDDAQADHLTGHADRSGRVDDHGGGVVEKGPASRDGTPQSTRA